MKIQHLPIIMLCFALFCACNSGTKSQKETKPVVKKQIPKKPVKQEAPFVYGIDISSYQGNEVDVINSLKDSLGFVICKATQGAFGTDPKFAENWSKIKTDGFLRGTYHFYVSTDDPIAQAKHFANTIKSIQNTDIAPVVDFEKGGIDAKQSTEDVTKGLVLFINTTEKIVGRKLMIYTDIPTADQYLRDEKFSTYALWIANYVKKPQPDLPIAWKNTGWTFWQRDADYKIEGFTNDSDVFNGDISKLQDFIKTY